MEGAPRLLLHGVVWGKAHSPAQNAEHMRSLVEVHRVQAFKLYPVWSPDGAGYRMDDPVSQAQSEYQNNPSPSFCIYGPRSAEELAALRRVDML